MVVSVKNEFNVDNFNVSVKAFKDANSNLTDDISFIQRKKLTIMTQLKINLMDVNKLTREKISEWKHVAV